MLDINPDLPQPSNTGEDVNLSVKGRSKVVLKLQDGYSLCITRRRDRVFISIKKAPEIFRFQSSFCKRFANSKNLSSFAALLSVEMDAYLRKLYYDVKNPGYLVVLSSCTIL